MTDRLPLPPGWIWTTIGEVGTAITGNTPSKKDETNYGDFIPFVKPPELRDCEISAASDNLSEKGATSARVLPPNSVLVSCIGNLGKTGINKIPVAFNQQINAIVFPNDIEPKYGFYYFQSSSAKDQLENLASATTVTIVNKSKFQTVELPLPPLAEQRRIVEAIETQFTRLEAGVAGLEQVRTKLRRYRAAVLKAACEGRLVPQNPDDEPAADLLARILTERRELWNGRGKYKEPAGISPAAISPPSKSPPAGGRLAADASASPPAETSASPPAGGTEGGRLPQLPVGWVWVTVEQVSEVATGATPKRGKDSYYKDGTVPWVTSAVVNELFVDQPSEFITELAIKETNAKVFPNGTLLVAMYGEGKTRGKVSELRIDAATNQALAGLLFNGLTEHYKPYVKLFFQKNYEDIRRLSSGGVQPNLNLSIIRQTNLPLPPLAEQRRIVEEVERRLSVVAEVEAAIEANLRRAARLRQAILKKAFAGELVAQNPADEPASALLARIRRV